MKCKICGQPSTLYDKAIILGKYDVRYMQCQTCGFVQAEDPHWLTEAYSDAITASDLGLVARNLGNSKICRALIPIFFDRRGKFVDYGGGYGLFVRMMRDTGFDFYLLDPLCENLFAKRFEADPNGYDRYELVTAFEVFEHLEDPLSTIEQMLRFSSNILFSTLLLPPAKPKLTEWQYFGLEHGQHISVYTEQTLAMIAKKFKLQVHSCRRSLHLFSQEPLKYKWLFDWVVDYRVGSLLSIIRKQPSLTPTDYFFITGTQLQP
ncbi:MAG: class I SAM-dependent methyltransferase [Gemmataceae bacterium]|jgi:hypothetical protein